MADDFSFEITEKIAVLSTSKTGWTLELNKVSWGGRPAKYDLRSWAPEHQKMGKGVTLTDEELKTLKATLNGLAD
ncbi:MAG: YdbC family protein [Treponema sp.]|nr:YdbC family protein [Treponema sp.]